MKLFKLVRCLILLGLMTQLFACAAVVVGGAAATGTAVVDRRTTGTLVEDQTIEIKAVQAIRADVELNEQAHMNITSYNSVVLITGETPTDAMRQRVMQLVKATEKVTHVYNELTIAAPSSVMSRSSDSYITAKVKTQMFANNEISGVFFKVVTEKGVVYLMGIVSHAEAEKATEIARQTGGVQKVVKLFQYTD
ncbi:MAG TPA: BON domain-containing protein [Thiotrichaceae bacterium]|jgi:osmotically-inducible protein OsmY|nr:BON domain-containing protein [Thiotrichaceae bacterium]HIM07180.1 BON domain-containing protein [Gammaproteobacteria bacterium]